MNIAKIAKLANIKLTPKEEITYALQIENILNYFKILTTVDTTNVTPTYQINNLKNCLRPDTPVPGLKLDGYISSPSPIHKK